MTESQEQNKKNLKKKHWASLKKSGNTFLFWCCNLKAVNTFCSWSDTSQLLGLQMQWLAKVSSRHVTVRGVAVVPLQWPGLVGYAAWWHRKFDDGCRVEHEQQMYESWMMGHITHRADYRRGGGIQRRHANNRWWWCIGCELLGHDSCLSAGTRLLHHLTIYSFFFLNNGVH